MNEICTEINFILAKSCKNVFTIICRTKKTMNYPHLRTFVRIRFSFCKHWFVMTRYLWDVHKQGTLIYGALVQTFCLRNCWTDFSEGCLQACTVNVISRIYFWNISVTLRMLYSPGKEPVVLALTESTYSSLQVYINLLKMKHLCYIWTQFVPRCKQSPLRL